MLTTLAVANYRSLQAVVAPLGALNVVTGANGSGKSSLYRALRLLADTAQGSVTASLALTDALLAEPACTSLLLKKEMGETKIAGQGVLHQHPWNWPAR